MVAEGDLVVVTATVRAHAVQWDGAGHVDSGLLELHAILGDKFVEGLEVVDLLVRVGGDIELHRLDVELFLDLVGEVLESELLLQVRGVRHI